MKKITMILSIALFASAHANEKVLRVSTDGAYPPFSEIGANGEMIGFDIDLANAICAQIKRTCEFKQIDWDGLIPALINEQVDALVAYMDATEERRRVIEFSDPYIQHASVFVRKKGNPVEMTQEGLKGKTIGVLTASIQDNYATDKFAKFATIDRYNSQDDAILDAQKGVVDVLFAERNVLQEGFLNRDSGKDFEIFGEEVAVGNGVAIGLRKEDTQLRNEINQALKTLRENGQMQKMYEKYFPDQTLPSVGQGNG